MIIRFGTSGWRGTMGSEFTFHNVRVVVQAIANHLKSKFPDGPVVVVGYDTRFLSERFAAEAAKLLAKNDIRVLLAERDAPSQALAFQIIKRGCQGGINFTASFNPPEDNGLKFNVETGAPALPEVTDAIEAEVQRLMPGFSLIVSYPPEDKINRIDVRADYLEFLQDKINFAAIRDAGLKIGVDLLFGASREYLDDILEENGIEIEEIHGFIDPYFGGVVPSCTEKNLAELRSLVRSTDCRMGVATDSDGDRFGILDDQGDLVHPNLILAMLLDYLITVKGWRGGVARSVTTTRLLDRIAKRAGLELMETKVGFKYIAQLFLENKIMFGGEESACFAVKDHLPEKDGIFAALLVAEMMALRGKSLGELKKDLFREYGRTVGRQETLPLTPERAKSLRNLIGNPPRRLGRRTVTSVETTDGLKLGFGEDSWIVLRFSGTEPLIRCYGEAPNSKDLDDLVKRGLECVQ